MEAELELPCWSTLRRDEIAAGDEWNGENGALPQWNVFFTSPVDSIIDSVCLLTSYYLDQPSPICDYCRALWQRAIRKYGKNRGLIKLDAGSGIAIPVDDDVGWRSQ
jgi:hypothetical protein